MSNSEKTATVCDHITTGCDACDPTGPARGVFGDHDGDFDADDARELEAEVQAGAYDTDPNPYEGTMGDDDCGGDY